jgi:hypothetical protein
VAGILVNKNGTPPPVFSDVLLTKDFKSNEFASVADKEVMGAICASVADAGVTEYCLAVLGSAIVREGSRFSPKCEGVAWVRRQNLWNGDML